MTGVSATPFPRDCRDAADADDRAWLHWAVGEIEADQARSADTHLIKVPLAGLDGIHVYFKDESTHPSGSLKHRLARSLFLYALCNGWVGEDTPVIEASSGSTAISEAYFARLLGLRFIAVVPAGTAAAKIVEIERLGAECHFAEGGDIYAAAEQLAADLGGHYMDQFTYAERATDWRGNNNIAESIFEQMAHERYPVPTWIVVGAGTGGTSATIGRYARYRRASCRRTRLAVVDPEGSVFAESWRTGRTDLTSTARSRIEGIGRPRVEPSFQPHVIDRMIEVADAASFAGARFLSARLGRRVGPSTGTNLIGVIALAEEMIARGEQGSIVSLMCDSGERYLDSAFNAAWLDANVPGHSDWATRLARY
ncbi:PLP-dependent cysteine synthase family protein [Hephaestia sp. GCM10023244]|uniref:PLP-dependent cysteine synthase family protein n=1 Tax=unclassified Hephaestia TaxID=2631281 RepID=UPI0020771633|nr:PLP-dependent cysteine synthase family protein [Hephaestia sp. MAHUQ-44]MCM8730321.1 PLP-dependent cysteine synthase family protein [Hephaestia sp. MAHUQ-44]